MASRIQTNEMTWHNDGHSLSLRLNKSELEITEIFCPNSPDRKCGDDDFCVVDYFINRYGFDCNIGVCAPNGTMEICWSLAGDPDNPDESQLWFVPINDEVFYAWMTSKANG